MEQGIVQQLSNRQCPTNVQMDNVQQLSKKAMSDSYRIGRPVCSLSFWTSVRTDIVFLDSCRALPHPIAVGQCPVGFLKNISSGLYFRSAHILAWSFLGYHNYVGHDLWVWFFAWSFLTANYWWKKSLEGVSFPDEWIAVKMAKKTNFQTSIFMGSACAGFYWKSWKYTPKRVPAQCNARIIHSKTRYGANRLGHNTNVSSGSGDDFWWFDRKLGGFICAPNSPTDLQVLNF